MSSLERHFGVQFVEARSSIQRFVDQYLVDATKDDEQVGIDAIRLFLKGKRSDYKPESAIPIFE
jgi:hypothetical protein